MNYTLNFDSRVVDDIKHAYQHYIDLHANNSTNLFLEQVNQIYDLLEQNPFLFRVYYNTIHCVVLNNFPYLIHYKINKKEHTVLVLAIYHTSSKPLWEY